MIPNIAIIVSAYAVARLLNSYILDDPKVQPLRRLVSAIAIVAIAVSLFGVLEASNSIGGLNI